MTPEYLAPRIYTAERELDNRPAWEDAGPFPRSVARAAAVAALAALKGPRTGEELRAALYNAQPFGKRPYYPEWADLDDAMQNAYNTVAATFSAPPEPVGWPEGFHLGRIAEVDEPSTIPGWRVEIMQRHGAATFCIATIHGPFQRDTEERARLVAQAIAKSRIVCGASQPFTGGISRQIYEDLKRDHKAVLAAHEQLRAEIVSLRARAESCHDALKDANGQITAARKALDEAGVGVAGCTLVEGIGFLIADVNAGIKEATDEVASTLASHLTPTVRRTLRPGLLTLLASTGEVSPEQLDEALDDADKMAALVLRVRAVGEF